MSAPVMLGRMYRCPVCGAKVILINADTAALELICCNVDMDPLDPPAAVYTCNVCGAQVAALKDGGGELDLVCCHEPMAKTLAEPVAA